MRPSKLSLGIGYYPAFAPGALEVWDLTEAFGQCRREIISAALTIRTVGTSQHSSLKGQKPNPATI